MIEKILSKLPQTQCEECGYKGCRPYAEAIVNGEAIDLCAPGGERVLKQLSEVTGRSGDLEKVKARYIPPMLAKIDQSLCIGCTKCKKPCPTEAIVGTKKQNHFVLASDCTGCGLCLPTCPVDCITLEPDALSASGKLQLSSEFRVLYEQKTPLKEKGLEVKSPKDMQAALQALLRDTDESS